MAQFLIQRLLLYQLLQCTTSCAHMPKQTIFAWRYLRKLLIAPVPELSIMKRALKIKKNWKKDIKKEMSWSAALTIVIYKNCTATNSGHESDFGATSKTSKTQPFDKRKKNRTCTDAE